MRAIVSESLKGIDSPRFNFEYDIVLFTSLFEAYLSERSADKIEHLRQLFVFGALELIESVFKVTVDINGEISVLQVLRRRAFQLLLEGSNQMRLIAKAKLLGKVAPINLLILLVKR